MTGSASRSALLGATLAAATLAGCGGGQRQDADEPAGTYAVRVVHASFPAAQHVAQQSRMRIEVRNDGAKTVPVIAVTVHGFDYRSSEPNLADPTRPTWIIDRGPRDGDTAYVDTWALGALPPGQSRTFEWAVTPVRAGRDTVRFEVAAGLDGRARVRRQGGRLPGGRFVVRVSGKPADARVDPGTGQVVRR